MKYNATLPPKPLLCVATAFFLAATAAYTQFSPGAFLVADAPGSIRGLTKADFNADGREDMLAVSDKYMFWVENTPDSLGYFRHNPLQTRSLSLGYPLIATADMDGDGDADLVTSDSATTWIPNNDLDKDGRPDLVAMGQNQIAVFRSSTGFSRTTVGQFDYGSDLTIGDFDNDGDLDLAAATTADTIRVLLFTNTDGFGQFDNGKRIDDARANCVAAAVPRPLVSPFAQPA